MYFKPYIGLSLITAIFMAILLSLGTWQMQRLEWKTQLLSELKIASQSDPFMSLAALEAADRASEPIDYRRITIEVDFISLEGAADYLEGPYYKDEAFHILRVREKQTGWRLYRLGLSSNRAVFIAADWIPDNVKMKARERPQESQYISGYVRRYEKPSPFAAQNTPSLNRWMSFNALADTYSWGDAAGQYQPPLGYYIDARQISSAPLTDRLDPLMPDVPNNHLDYMLTWYSFAFILFVIYLLLHIRGNRLKLKV